jgi:hypothetical protein
MCFSLFLYNHSNIRAYMVWRGVVGLQIEACTDLQKKLGIKSSPVTGLRGPEGSRSLRFPD